MPISIYPPILKSTLPAFLNTISNYLVYFTLLRMTNKDEIKHILIRVTKLSNNRSIVNTAMYPDGIIYKNISFNNIGTVYNESGSSTIYYIPILTTDLLESWQPGFLYKILMRFGKTDIFTSVDSFAAWKQLQINNQTFSEWSTVMVVKAISEPDVYIQNAGISRLDVTQSERSETTKTPLFTGVYNIDDSNREAEDIYKFVLYAGNDVDENNQLEDSGWLLHNATLNTVDYHRFNTLLNNNETYTVIYLIKTINGYESKAEPYTFLINESTLSRITGITFEVDDLDVYCSENGCMNIYLTADSQVSGNYVITRSSEKTNFLVYEDIKFLMYSRMEFPTKTLIFLDFTIESGVKYKYAILQENSAGLRTAPLYEEYSPARVVNFEYAFLYHDDVLLRLKFNNTMSTFKHTVLSSKLDTLGDKYPHLVKNGYAYYAEFPVTGLISLEMDSDLTFFKLGLDGYYYKDKLVIPAYKYTVNDTDIVYNRDLTHDNIYIERIFREKAEEFLNDFDYKLYKSPTEGNIVVVLQNVSLTPKQELGRMIFEFSATAYEVLENTISNLNEFKIIDVGSFRSLTTEESFKSFGQISGLFSGSKTLNVFGNYVATSPQELLTEIRKIEEVSITGGYKMAIKKIRALRVELYPQIKFDAELTELEARRAILINNGEDTSEVDLKIEEYENLGRVISSTPETKIVTLRINGKEIVMGIGKIYLLNDIDEDITSIQLKYTMPIIINYICDLEQREDENVGVVSSVDTSRIWGLISGIFTETDSILKNYNFKYLDSKTYRVYNLYPDSTIRYGPYGDIILDNTTINLYKYKNLLDIIKEETKRQVEIMYGVGEGFTHYDETTGQWDNGAIYYEFNGIYLFDIEASPGTIISIGKRADGSDKTLIVIGPTSRYVLNPCDLLIEYVAIESDQFAIINYKCLTSLMTMTRRGE